MNLPKEKLRLLFGLTLQISASVPESVLKPSVNQINISSGELWVFISPKVHANNDPVDFGEVIDRNSVT